MEVAYSGQMKWRDAVSFLLKVAKAGDPKKMTEGDRINLIEGLRQYLETEGPGMVDSQLTKARSDPALLRPVIDVVREIANAAAHHKRLEVKLGPRPLVLVFEGNRLDGDRVAAYSEGDLHDVVADIAVADFGMAEPWQIGRCRWGICGKLFLANRKGQVFCSHDCANSASSEAYQERMKARMGRGKARRGGK